MRFELYVTVACMLAISPFSNAKNHLQFVDVSCSRNDEVVANITCFLTNETHDVPKLFVRMQLIKEVPNAIIRVDLFQKKNDFQPFLTKIILNLCKILSGQNLTPQEKLIKRVIVEFSQTKRICPLMGNYSVSSVTPGDTLIPWALPRGIFRVDVVLSTPKTKGYILFMKVTVSNNP